MLLKIDGVDYNSKKELATELTNDLSATLHNKWRVWCLMQFSSLMVSSIDTNDTLKCSKLTTFYSLGILHVDYESLIPYLSESIRANFNDIKNTQAKTERIEKVVDQLYQQFLKQENERLQREQRTEDTDKLVVTVTPEPSPIKRAWPKQFKIPAGCVIIAIIALTLTGSIIGVVYLAPVTFKGTIKEVPALPYDPEVEHIQRAILLKLYTDTNGSSWNNSTRWATDASVCTWHGIECANGDGHVTNIYLVSNNLTGTLSPSLGDLSSLVNLTLMDNDLQGTIPPQLFQLNKLEALLLAHNSLIGSVPEEFSQLRSLKVLQLGFNKITKLPSSLKNMKSLKILEAQDNLLRGPLPDLSVTSLVTVDLSSNNFEGPLPKVPADMEVIILSNNHLNGTIENLYDLDDLRLLRINNNSFSGDISFSRRQWYMMDEVDLSNNEFTGFKEENIVMNPDAGCIANNNKFICPLPKWTSKCFAQCNGTDFKVGVLLAESRQPKQNI